MKGGTRTLACAGAAAICALAIWVLATEERSPRAPAPVRTRPADPDAASRQVGAEPEPPGARTTLGDPGAPVLELRATAGGQPALARAVWVHAADPFDLDAALPPASPDDEGGDARGRVQFTGATTLSLAEGQWTLLRVRDLQRPTLVRHLRVPPEPGRHTVRVELGPIDGTALRVQAWAAGACGALADADLRVFWEPLGAAGKPRRWVLRTDATGFAELDGLPPGAIRVLTPSARDADPWPAAVRLIVSPYDVPRELSCAVVEPDRKREVELSILADAGLPPGGARLFARNLNGGELHPQRGTLREGASDDLLLAPDGEYELGVLPIGLAAVEPRTLTVRGDGAVRVRVRVPSSEHLLVLDGIASQHFPLRVVPQTDAELGGTDARLLFVGPPRWTVPEVVVRSAPAGARLIALARTATFLSEGEVAVAERTVLRMRPASLLHVEWLHGVRTVEGTEAVVSVRAGGFAAVRFLRPRLAEVGGVFRPVLSAQIAVPQGPVVLTGLGTGGKEIWCREFEATRPQQIIRVGESSP
jgi:hypothetical protein